jgi:hypothetical protein
VLGVALALLGLRWFATPRALGPNPYSSGASLPAQAGQRVWFGFAGFLPHGDAPVHVTGLRLLGAPAGLTVLSTAAAVARHGYPLVATDIDLKNEFPDLDPQPVDHAVIVPGKPEGWFLLAAVSAKYPGHYRTTGIEVDYQMGWRRGSAVFNYSVELDVTK